MVPFEVGKNTLSQITSVKVGKKEPNTGCSTWILIAAGCVALALLVALLSSIGESVEPGKRADWLVGLAVCSLVVWALSSFIRNAKPTYSVEVTTAAGEKSLLSSQDRAVPQAIVDALVQALADRG